MAANPQAAPEENEVREDPAYEARLGIGDRIMCRICGFWSRADLSPDHIARHIDKKQALARWGARGLAREYNRLYPGAPTSIHGRRAKKLGKDVNQVMAEYADAFLPPGELEGCRRDVKAADNGDYCVCLVCGQKLEEHLQSHLKREHGMSLHEYEGTYPGAPLVCTRARNLRLARSLKFQDRRKAELEELRTEVSKYPPDWWEKPIDLRIIGNELLSQKGYMSNEELADRLDSSRILKCPYGPTWRLSVDTRGSLLRINEARKWVKRPGGRQNMG